MAERSPFERLFTPDQGGSAMNNIFSSIGSAFGVQNQQERTGELRSQALQEFARIQQEEGLPPQQAFLKLMQSPTGMELFKTPGGIEDLQKVITAQTPPPPTIATTGPGQKTTSFGRDGKPISSISQPPNDVQTFQHYAGIADLQPERLRQIAEIQMMPAEDRKYTMLLQAGFSKELAAKLASGAIEVKQGNNFDGSPTGKFYFLDKATFRVTEAGGGQRLNPGSNTQSTVAPSTENPMGLAEPDKVAKFLGGTGIYPQTLRYLDNITRSAIGPTVGSEAGDVASIRQKELDKLRFLVSSFPTVAGRTNHVVKRIEALLPSMLGSASDSLNAAISLHQLVHTGMADAEEIITDEGGLVGKDAKVEASKEYVHWRRIAKELPQNINDLILTKEEVMRSGGGAHNIVTGAGSVMEAIKSGWQAGAGAAGGIDPSKASSGGQPANGSDVPLPRRDPRPRQRAIEDMSFEELKALDPMKFPPSERPKVINRLREELRKAAGQR